MYIYIRYRKTCLYLGAAKINKPRKLACVGLRGPMITGTPLPNSLDTLYIYIYRHIGIDIDTLYGCV